MATRPQAQIEPVRIGAGQLQWSVYSRIAFRVSFLYFVLYCLTNQIILGLVPISGIDIPDLASLTPIRQVVFWAATHLFGISSPLVYKGSGSGDKTFDWVLVFCILCTTVVAAAVWSVFDRERANYTALHKWFHVFLRFAVGSTMVGYGMLKVVPLQMPFPFLTRLVEPFGNFSPMGVLWYSIGASPAYERFVGSAE